MSLPLPNLDARTYDELTREGMALLPQRSPGWTDHNPSDPGVTLLELFAWLAELLLYRADLVTPAMLRAALRLVGVEPAPAAVASTVVAIRRAPGAPGTLTLAAGSELDPGFATVAALEVSPAWLELDAAETTERGVLVAERAGVLQAVRRERPYAPFTVRGDALRIGFDVAPGALALYAWSSNAPAPPPDDRCPPATTVWEYSTGVESWRAFAGVADATHALSLSGPVALAVADDHAPGAGGRWWIRCRLASGGFDCPPLLRALAVNAIGAAHAVAVERSELLAQSRGQAEQCARLRYAPVVPGSAAIRVGAELWTEVADWDRSGPGAPHFVLDSELGTVAFGNGRRGAVPPDGARIVAESYARGSGAAGNVAAGTLRAVAAAERLAVLQPLAATGGAPPESLGRAHGRALARITRPTRAVTVADIEALALATPGVTVARARALPGIDPALPCVHAAGVVTVIVLGPCGTPPRPGPAFLAAVARHLEPRRPLGTELIVAAPEYADVTVEVTLHARRTAPPDLAARAAAALARFYDPLRGGPDGTGWPFGRAVRAAEVLAALAAVDGVIYADGLRLGPAAECDAIAVCPTELVNLLPPRIAVAWE